jgi:hypothetical protein
MDQKNRPIEDAGAFMPARQFGTTPTEIHRRPLL